MFACQALIYVAPPTSSVPPPHPNPAPHPFPSHLPRPPYPRGTQMILSIGDLLLDITIVPDGPLRPDDDRSAKITLGGGGQPANFCSWAAALGEPTRLITRVGDDENGRKLVADLEAHGVEVCATWAPEPTGAIAVIVGPDGGRAMATQRGASIGLRPDDLAEAW